jgi:ATP-dependent DNA helicase DinG
LAQLFQLKDKSAASNLTKKTKTKANQLKPVAAFEEIDLLGFYDDQGPLSQTIKNYESRPTQKKMTAKILDAFVQNYNLLVEAGTGTGKTMAYLLPSVYWSLKNNQQIIISTHTKNLQEQIIEKDIPLLQRTLHKINKEINFTSASLKGRRNYLSTKRLEFFLQKDFFEDHEAVAMIKILIWLYHTKTGNFEELSLHNKEFSVLDDICCAEYVCPHEDSQYANSCWLLKARKQAENANILVVNHALLMQNAIAEKPLLPEPQSKYLIVDEAHHLEKSQPKA